MTPTRCAVCRPVRRITAPRLDTDKAAGALLPDEAAAPPARWPCWKSGAGTWTAPWMLTTPLTRCAGRSMRRCATGRKRFPPRATRWNAPLTLWSRRLRTARRWSCFVNELALGPDSAPFLAENECERFEQYSEKLLLHGGEDELLAELQRDDVRGGNIRREF